MVLPLIMGRSLNNYHCGVVVPYSATAPR